MLRPVLVLDFGSQYTQLIARRIRELGVWSVIEPYNYSIEKILKINPFGIILSGGPMSVYDKNSPKVEIQIFKLNIPVLGICYGMQLIAHLLNGKVEGSKEREYGLAKIKTLNSPLFEDLPGEQIVWMSHGDRVEILPSGFNSIASSENTSNAAFFHSGKKIFGVQFHPEVKHTKYGNKILNNFLKICNAEKNWSMKSYKDMAISQIREKVKDSIVIGGLSGGVDSTVAGTLLAEAIGENFYGIFVDTGLLRKGEGKDVMDFFKKYHLKIKRVKAGRVFYNKLKNVSMPEKKRKIIGNTFIKIFEKEARKIKEARFLLQGTIYPDVIESNPVFGPSASIKAHHNVKGLPKKMKLKLIEPLRFLFKDEVRKLGQELGVPDEILKRHPFPGPGLAVRILGNITKRKVRILQDADTIFIEELKKNGFYDEVAQAFVVLLPVKSVGVMGDKRTYEYVCAIRAVSTADFMTADISNLPFDFLKKIASRIVNEVKGINRVVYDFTTKPPGTIEWE